MAPRFRVLLASFRDHRSAGVLMMLGHPSPSFFFLMIDRTQSIFLSIPIYFEIRRARLETKGPLRVCGCQFARALGDLFESALKLQEHRDGWRFFQDHTEGATTEGKGNERNNGDRAMSLQG